MQRVRTRRSARSASRRNASRSLAGRRRRCRAGARQERGATPFGCRVQGRRGPGGSARAAPSLLWYDWPTFVRTPSPGSIPVAAATLGVGEPSECVDRGTGVRVRIETDAALSANAAPLACQERAAEQVWPDCQAVVVSLVALAADADQRGLIGEQRWSGSAIGRFVVNGPDSPTNISHGANSQRHEGAAGQEKCGLPRAVCGAVWYTIASSGSARLAARPGLQGRLAVSAPLGRGARMCRYRLPRNASMHYIKGPG